MLMLESPTAVRLIAGGFDFSSRRLSHSANFFISDSCCEKRNNCLRGRVRASAEEQVGGPLKQNAKPQRYHPSEDIGEAEVIEIGEARLTPEETCRTIIEVNSKALLMFSGLLSDEVHDNIFWPDLPYITDENGNIYFQVKNDEDILQTLTTEDTLVQVIIGLDTKEMLSEMELLNQSDDDFGITDVDDDSSDGEDDEDNDEDDDENEEDDNYEEEWVAVLDDEDDGEDSDESPGDWAKLETMRASHPIYFAKKLAEFVGDNPVDYMDQPPAGIAIQGILRPSFLEEHSVIYKNKSDCNSEDEANQVGKVAEDKQDEHNIINGHSHSLEVSQDKPDWPEELDKGESLESGTSFYKLEMVKIQLISAHGQQTFVEVDDFRRARPDAIAHSAAKIISRLKAGEEKTTHALKSFCWRCKGIQAEEVALIGVDSLGFDLRVCSGIQVQTLRFAFKKRASSEYSAERQLNDLLFPRIQGKQQKKKETHQSEL
ncbi:FMN-binding split barrel [Heracleum sosnowskyi]|uniref:FMN-binding split barrel n=1 Tax=Heracleum sosnowskyi TaxID=360622 RepID=A0AAD8H6Y0_9APIA|nr:FMN-binding split barrel [Heracleum sosnowskyi]